MNSKLAGAICFAIVLGGCSSSAQQPVVSAAPGQGAPGAGQGQHAHQASDKPLPAAVTHCDSLSGSYQMNSDNFSLNQEGCGKLTWTYAPQMTFDDNDEPVRDAHGMPVMTPEKKVVWQLNGEEREGQRSYFLPDGKHLVVEKDDGSSDVYFIASEGICDLYNPQGQYLVVETFAAGDNAFTNRTACHFWARN
jgi:hypothetical protein